MRYPHLYRNCIKFKYAVLLLATWHNYIQATLYPFGSATNDEEVVFSSWDRGSTRIQLLSDLLAFGDGFISSIWVS